MLWYYLVDRTPLLKYGAKVRSKIAAWHATPAAGAAPVLDRLCSSVNVIRPLSCSVS